MGKLLITSLGKCLLIALLLFRSFFLLFKTIYFSVAPGILIFIVLSLIICRKLTGVWHQLSLKLMGLTILILKRLKFPRVHAPD
jgi:hypothetical protein